ncbi:MAG: hypothetical protein ACD_79C01251G0001 [uncultured bacterium]|nr:MAG: hypothetical protein ACD_79C01251G0001 [uncultured bacterium]
MYNLNSIFPVRDSIEVKFKSKKIALKGITLPSGQLKQGDSFNMDFYFLFEEKVRNDFAVFVHFKSPDGKTLFQNDHFLGNDTNIKHFIEGELLEDQSIITIPSKLEYKGKVEIWLGIWDPYKKKRFKPETPLPNKDRSVKIGEFNIE